MPHAAPRATLIAPDLLRFACAAAVVAFHLGTQMWRRPSPYAATVLARAGIFSPGWPGWTRFGWVGVEIFFVISGFMIAAAVGDGGVAFIRRRLLRLAPAVWICASITLVCLLHGGGGSGSALAWLNAISFMPWGWAIDPSYWTLGIELSFYFAMAFAWRDASAGERADRMAAVLAVASLSFWVADLLLWREPVMSPGRASQLLLLPHGCFFAGGIVLARCRASGADSRRLTVAAMAAVGGTLEIAHHAGEQAVIFQVGFAPWWPLALVGGGIAILASAAAIQPVLERWIGVGTARLIGLSTYPLYLLHQEVGASLIVAFTGAGLPVGMAVLSAVVLLMLVALAIARWAEPAVRMRLDQVLRRRAGRHPAPSLALDAG